MSSKSNEKPSHSNTVSNWNSSQDLDQFSFYAEISTIFKTFQEIQRGHAHQKKIAHLQQKHVIQQTPLPDFILYILKRELGT